MKRAQRATGQQPLCVVAATESPTDSSAPAAAEDAGSSSPKKSGRASGRSPSNGRSIPKVRETGKGGLTERTSKALEHIPGVRFWRNNCGVMKSGPRWIRFGVGGNGGADFLGIVTIHPHPESAPVGRFVAIELKTPDGKQTDDQRAFERVVYELGGVYVLARSVDEAVIAVLRIQRGEW